MKRSFLQLMLVFGLSASAQAAEMVKPAIERFAKETDEQPDFRRHVLPLMGRIGCNGRACHGSFQGQGGFQLSLFGYDFEADHKAIAQGDEPRVNKDKPEESLILQKPTLAIEHEGGERIKPDSWQYRLLHNWIKGGAKGLPDDAPEFARLEVQPSQIVFKAAGETTQLKVIAHWSDGSSEDVTAISRYRTNDESIAKIDESGKITALSKGDTDVVAFYDNGVFPVQVILPVTDLVGPKYPQVPAPTKIDQLVVAKLSKLGIVPSDECTDAEFLRRLSIDMTGTLPTAKEVEAFLADSSPDKRNKKIDELLERPAYAAWWATKLCDITGNNERALRNTGVDSRTPSQQWYTWIHDRVRDNRPYDEIVEGIVVARGRKPGQSYEEYCAEMSAYYTGEGDKNFADREDMPHYWMRRTLRQPEDKALGFSYAFLGIRLQCAQCHKHPFDQWTKQDFDEFKSFFTRVQFGLAPDARKIQQEMTEELGVKDKKGNMLQKELASLVKQGKVVPFQEVFVTPPRNNPRPNPKQKNQAKGRQQRTPAATGRLLGGDRIDLTKFEDPREALMEWIRKEPSQYFARSFVNRVWASYFSVGIVNPPDDLNLANPPSNPELLDYLTNGFVENKYDMKWLHREIARSRTYQLSWKPNATNQLDMRNFSRAMPRRLPAEVAYDAIAMATASDDEIAKMQAEPQSRAIGLGVDMSRGGERRGSNYVFAVFGKPDRSTNCDCERSSEPSLLQTVYMRNDFELLNNLDRKGSWISSLAEEAKDRAPKSEKDAAADAAQLRTAQQQISRMERRAQQLRKKDNQANKKELAKVEQRLKSLRKQVAKAKAAAATKAKEKASSKPVSFNTVELVREAYLRTVNRLPTDEESARAKKHVEDAKTPVDGAKDLMWALLNTKEFIVNH